MHILIADDHALVREGLTLTLGALAPEAHFSEAEDADQVRRLLDSGEAPDLLLLDLFMPGNDNFGLLSELCRNDPDLLIVVLSASTDPAHMRKALDLGASGYIPKSSTANVMLSALRLVLAGGIYVPPDMLKSSTVESGLSPTGQTVAQVGTDAETGTPLTGRQLHVLACLADGKSNKQIARELDLSENTVKNHVAAILRPLGVGHRPHTRYSSHRTVLFPSDHLRPVLFSLLLALHVVACAEGPVPSGNGVLVVMETENARHRDLLAAFAGAVSTSDNGAPGFPIKISDVSDPADRDRTVNSAPRPALVVTVGTRAAERELQRDDQTPVLSVFLPDVAYRQLQAVRATKTNRETAAIVLDQPVARQLAIAATLLPDARRAGALFSDDAEAAISTFRAQAGRFGLAAAPERVGSHDEAANHIETLVRRSDVVLAVYDHRLFRPVTAKWLLYVGLQERRPVIGFSYALLKAGAVAAVYSTPEQIGLHAAEAAQAWLAGERPPTVQAPAHYNIGINGPVANALGVDVPDEAAFGARVRQRLGDRP